nr:hypothetical protein [Stenotrophomonas acidaminiphila]
MPAAPSSPPPCALPAPGLAATRRGFLGRHLLIPLLLAVAASVVLMAGNGDQWLADQLYRWEGSRWAFKDAWWTTHVIHRGGKNLSTLAGVLVMLALLRACLDTRWKALRRPLLYLLLAVGLSTGMVALLKSMTQMDCPWDLQRYGGLRPFIGLFESRPELLGRAACFPRRPCQRRLRLGGAVLFRPAGAPTLALGGTGHGRGHRAGVRLFPAAARCALSLA